MLNGWSWPNSNLERGASFGGRSSDSGVRGGGRGFIRRVGLGEQRGRLDVTRIDPETGKVQATIKEQVDGPKGLTVTADAVWVLSYPDSWVTRIESLTGTVTATVPIAEPWASGAGSSGVWVASRSGQVWRIDPTRNQLASSVTIPGVAAGLAVGNRRVWVADRASGQLTSVDTRSHRVSTVKIRRPLADVAVGGGSVWVTVR